MNNRINTLIAGLGLGALASVLLAQTPTRTLGQVLLLDNTNAVHGEIELRGDVYIVRRTAGEISVPATKVLMVCESLEAAFKLLCGQANLRDPNERLRLAKWCQSNGLKEQAAAEARAALGLAPGHAEAAKILAMLEREAAPRQPAPPTTAGIRDDNPSVQYTSSTTLEVSADSLALFSNKVQPILMNACASCHATSRGGAFLLTRPTEGNSRRVLQANLAATIKHLCFEQPAQSMLLHKACSAHGGAESAPFPNQQVQPMQTLLAWAELTAARNPQLKTHGSTAVGFVGPSTMKKAVGQLSHKGGTASSVPIARSVDVAAAGFQSGGMPPDARVIPSEPALAGAPVPPRPLASMPSEYGQPTSEFDPMIFNRMWHSGR